MKKKSEQIIEENRYRNFMVLFYDESKHYDLEDVLFNLHSLKYYAYIKHQPESDEKQEHYHAFIRLDSATTEERLASRLGIPKDKVQYVKNVRGGCRYLTHIDYPEKIQNSLGISSGINQKHELDLKNIEFFLGNQYELNIYNRHEHF